MNNKARYNYFNLIVRSLIGFTALLFIYYKLKDSFYIQIKELDSANINVLFILGAVLLSFVNWGLESIKWKYLISKIKMVSFFKSYQIVLTGITMSLITPNRVGEIPARAFLVGDKENMGKLVYSTLIGSFTQLIITIFLGTIGIIFTLNWFDVYFSKTLLTSFVIVVLSLFTILFFSNSIKTFFLKLLNKQPLIEFNSVELITALILSLLRYVVFILQYFLLLEAFGIHFFEINSLWLIPVCFFVASSIPTFLISEIGVRSSVAIVVFGVLSSNDVAIIASSVTLWIINIAIPAIVGIGFMKQLKIQD